MNNMDIYNAVRSTPQEAQKTITGGRLNGFTDINPQYRIERLTEQFGPCGMGWYYTPDRKWTEQVGEEILCFVDISLYYKWDGEWSKPVTGTGGSTLLTKERSGLRASDEGYKMATTDAISVASKQIGIGADVYWAKGESKYNRPAPEPERQPEPLPQQAPTKRQRVDALCNYHGIDEAEFGQRMSRMRQEGAISDKSTADMDDAEFGTLLSLMHTELVASKQSA